MKSEKMQRAYKIIMLVVLTVFLTFLLTTVYYTKKLGIDGNTKYIMVQDESESIGATLQRFKTLIDSKFLGEVNEEDLKNGAIKGYIAGLNDEYTQYFTKEEMDEFYVDTMGNFDGIGIYMTSDTNTNTIVIISPIKDSPAHKAGLLPGDIINKVDGKSYSGEELDEASNAIKGEIGTSVELEINRNGEVFTVNVTRENVKVNHVESKIIDGNIGYLEIASFDEGCGEEFLKKYNELKEQNITSLIIDLRNNPGGIVTEALDIAEYVVDKDALLLITMDKNNNKEEYRSEANGKVIDVPVVILVNENSASASEILAGALKDNNAARIIGTTTYGKGLIQELIRLTDGSGIKMTTNEYYTPNQNRINKVGITPDEIVELPEEFKDELDIPEESDTQLQKAIEFLKK